MVASGDGKRLQALLPDWLSLELSLLAHLCLHGWLVFLKGNPAVPCRWDQVAFLWRQIVNSYSCGAYTGSAFKYTVQRANGVQIVLTQQFRNDSQLVDPLESEVTDRLVPQALAAVKDGQTLPFGPFNLRQLGLATPKEVIPWSEMQQVGIISGWNTIERRGQRTEISPGRVNTVPDLIALLAVADRLAQGRGL